MISGKVLQGLRHDKNITDRVFRKMIDEGLSAYFWIGLATGVVAGAVTVILLIQ